MFEDLAEPVVQGMMDETCTKLRAAGASIAEPALPSGFDKVIPRQRMVMAVEAARFHEERVKRNPEEYGPCIRSLLDEGFRASALDYARAYEEYRTETSDAVHACFGEVDALIMPATTSPAPDRRSTGDPALNAPWSYTGFPVISIPVAWTEDKMPLGIQLVGRRWDESRLFAVAAWCEQVIGWTRAELD
jgi:aspartyl-tRNA(Asn)/glutamyl-tRNA(Gln) amidotransferase subunit A